MKKERSVGHLGPGTRAHRRTNGPYVIHVPNRPGVPIALNVGNAMTISEAQCLVTQLIAIINKYRPDEHAGAANDDGLCS